MTDLNLNQNLFTKDQNNFKKVSGLMIYEYDNFKQFTNKNICSLNSKYS